MKGAKESRKRELERDRIAAQENERADKLAERADRIAAQKKIGKSS